MSDVQHGEVESALAMSQALAARQVSAVELVERALRRLDAWEPTLNAFSQVWAEEALAEARRVDASRPADLPYAGVPIAVKDLYDVAGRETTGCCAAYRGRVAAQDAPIIAAVRRAGLIIIGKTNQHELAAGGTNAVSACGPVHNPWDPERVPGGSSGGSGAAVAAGIVPWTLGSDTGGSIRIPASMCGIVGLKPTTGQLSTAGMLPLAPSLDTPGPMAATVEDTAALYTILAGTPPLPNPPPPGGRELVRIGVPGGYFAEHVHSDIVTEVHRTAEVLRGAGAIAEAVDGRGIDDTRSVWMRITFAEFAEAHPTLWREQRDQVAPSVLDWMDQGVRFSAEERAEAAHRRAEITAWFRERLGRYDALLVPTLPYWAPKLGQQEIDLGANGTTSLGQVGPGWHTCTANLAGFPAINLPAGRSPDGLPIGVSLVGRNLSTADGELQLLSLGSIWASASGYHFAPATLPSA